MANSFTILTPKKNVDEVALVKASEKTLEQDKKTPTGVNVTISEEGLKKLRNEEPKEKSKLPPHIEQLKQRIKDLKQEVEKLKQQIEVAQQDSSLDENAQKELLKGLYTQMASQQGALQETSTALSDALKEMGIKDPKILLEAIS